MLHLSSRSHRMPWRRRGITRAHSSDTMASRRYRGSGRAPAKIGTVALHLDPLVECDSVDIYTKRGTEKGRVRCSDSVRRSGCI
jgi:hypothetical protein